LKAWQRAVLLTLLALGVRFGVLVYNEVVMEHPQWADTAPQQLERAKNMIAGRPAGHTVVDDYGLSYVHVLLGGWDGQPSFLRLRVFHLLFDGLLTLAVFRMGMLLAGSTAAVLSGLTYAFFMPEVMLAATPVYDVWPGWGFVLGTWLALESFKASALTGKAAALMIAAGVFSTITGVVRSTGLLFAPFLAVLLFVFVSGKLKVRAFYPLCLMVGWTLVVLPLGAQNMRLFGKFRLLRGTVGHSFWTGVGEYPNRYNVGKHDGDVIAFYKQLPGADSPEFSEEYDRRLREAAISYVRENPVEYFTTSTRRAVRAVWSQKYWGLWADVWNPVYYGLLELAHRDPVRFIMQNPLMASANAFGRLMDWAILPFSLILAFVFKARAQLLIATTPLVYTIATLAPFHMLPGNATNAYAAILPVCAVGMLATCGKLTDFWKTRRTGHPAEST
jgi:hypothetical protein